MSFKPFKSPLLVHPGTQPDRQSTEPPPKRRKINTEVNRQPLAVIKNTPSPERPTEISSSNGAEGYYLVLWQAIVISLQNPV
jgi:hypothetical protein